MRDADWRGETRRFGEGAAILIGDLAFVYADQMLRGAPADAIDVFNELRLEVNVGQYLDLIGTVRGDATVELARTICRYKSGKYTVERPLHLGAALAGRLDELQAPLSAYGDPLGRGVPAARRPARHVRRRRASPASPLARTCARVSRRRCSRSPARRPPARDATRLLPALRRRRPVARRGGGDPGRCSNGPARAARPRRRSKSSSTRRWPRSATRRLPPRARRTRRPGALRRRAGVLRCQRVT